MIKWIISLIGNRDYHVGNRISTPRGMGTVIGGAIHVRLDNSQKGYHESNKTWSFNLENLND